MKKIVIIEDEIFMREELVYILENEGYETVPMNKFVNISDEIIASSPDLILLDLNLPGISGFEICKEIRHRSNVPILILTGRDQMKDELHGLSIGADEFINKPCHKERLIARINNLLKRSEDRSHLVEVNDIALDVQTYLINIKGQTMILPENQGRIMELLLKNYEKTVSKDEILKKLWGTTEYIDENAIHVNMTRLKKTLSQIASDYKITTVRGKGYILERIGESFND